jgi:hypothetical protein
MNTCAFTPTARSVKNVFMLQVFFALVTAGMSLALLAQPFRPGKSDTIQTTVGTNRVSMTVSGGERLIQANGIPDHKPGQFPRRGNPNSLSEQHYSFQVPSQPRAQAHPTPIDHALFGVAVNGVPFDPGTAEFWNRDRRSGWNYEAKGSSIDLGLDEHNAHVQPTGAYHYHGIPTGLLKALGGDEHAMKLLGYAADGFPIYTARVNSDQRQGSGPLKTLRSSYRLKSGSRPSGPGGKYDGSFTADWEYVKGLGDLDECNGTYGVTPQFPGGTYFYCLTEEFPFVPRFWRGTPDESFFKRPPPGPGGGFRDRPPPPRSGNGGRAEKI